MLSFVLSHCGLELKPTLISIWLSCFFIHRNKILESLVEKEVSDVIPKGEGPIQVITAHKKYSKWILKAIAGVPFLCLVTRNSVAIKTPNTSPENWHQIRSASFSVGKSRDNYWGGGCSQAGFLFWQNLQHNESVLQTQSFFSVHEMEWLVPNIGTEDCLLHNPLEVSVKALCTVLHPLCDNAFLKLDVWVTTRVSIFVSICCGSVDWHLYLPFSLIPPFSSIVKCSASSDSDSSTPRLPLNVSERRRLMRFRDIASVAALRKNIDVVSRMNKWMMWRT